MNFIFASDEVKFYKNNLLTPQFMANTIVRIYVYTSFESAQHCIHKLKCFRKCLYFIFPILRTVQIDLSLVATLLSNFKSSKHMKLNFVRIYKLNKMEFENVWPHTSLSKNQAVSSNFLKRLSYLGGQTNGLLAHPMNSCRGIVINSWKSKTID